MKALATLCLTAFLLAGALGSAAAAGDGSPQPSAIERLVRQEDARGTVGSPSQAPAQPTDVERLVRQEDARRNDPALGITRATQVSSVPAPPRMEVVARDGFDWLDAAIGFASAMALVAGLGCATLVVRALTLRQGITLVAVAAVATVVGAGVAVAGGAAPWLSALDARSEALNEAHGLGVERRAFGTPGPRWLDALYARSDALNRRHGLGENARESARASSAPDWRNALNARGDALNRHHRIGEYEKR